MRVENCFSMIENAERPITIEVGTNILVGSDTKRIIEESMKIIRYKAKTGKVPDLWDGRAAERIVRIIIDNRVVYRSRKKSGRS